MNILPNKRTVVTDLENIRIFHPQTHRALDSRDMERFSRALWGAQGRMAELAVATGNDISLKDFLDGDDDWKADVGKVTWTFFNILTVNGFSRYLVG